MSRSPFEPLLLAARGTKRRRAVTIITIAALGYMIRYCPAEIWTHWYDILQILIGLTVLDLVQETINAPEPAAAPRALPAAGDCPLHPGYPSLDFRGRSCPVCRHFPPGGRHAPVPTEPPPGVPQGEDLT